MFPPRVISAVRPGSMAHSARKYVPFLYLNGRGRRWRGPRGPDLDDWPSPSLRPSFVPGSSPRTSGGVMPGGVFTSVGGSPQTSFMAAIIGFTDLTTESLATYSPKSSNSRGQKCLNIISCTRFHFFDARWAGEKLVRLLF